MNHTEISQPNLAPNKKMGTLTRITIAAGAAAAILGNEGCSTTSWAAAGWAIGSFGWPITAAVWAGIWANVGKNAEESREQEKDVKKLFDAVPPAIIQKSAREWKTLAHFVSPDNSVVLTPIGRKGNISTFQVIARYGKENKNVWPVDIERDISK